MKTQIIQLEAHDDAISARDKMGAGQASRILLVWPQKKRLLTRRLDLVILQRYSVRLGAQLGLVTRDEEVRYFAIQLGIPVFVGLRQAQNDAWRTSRRLRRRPFKRRERPDFSAMRYWMPSQAPARLQHPAARLGIFSLSLAALFALAAVLLPGARIILTPRLEQQSLTLKVQANPDLDAPLLAGELPVKSATVIVEGRNTQAASGTLRVPEKPASGEVEFNNLTQEPVDIPAGTVVTTLDSPVVRFATIQAGKVSAGIGQKTLVPVQAVAPGSPGNLPANKLQAIEGPLGLRLTVNNLQSTRQGSDRPVASPTQADRDSLFAHLQANLAQTAHQELQARLPIDGTITDLPLLPTLRLRRVLEESYLPGAGQPAAEVGLLLRLEYEFQLVTAADLQALAIPILSATMPKDYGAVPGTLRLELGSVVVDDQGVLRWQMTFRQKIQSRLAPAQAVDLTRGLRVDQAVERLQTALDLAQKPNIQVSPSWWPYLPYLPFRIDVELQTIGGN